MLKISLLANLLLGVMVLLLTVRARSGKEQTGTTAPDSTTHMAEISTVPPSAGEETSGVSSREFRWSQLESTNYQTYITNLRNIGCPEQTIRDIVKADLDGLYLSRRAELEQIKAAKGNVPSPDSRRLDTELQQLRDEQASIMTSLLEGRPSSAPGIDPPRIPRVKPEEAASPLVFQDVDLALLKLTPEQIEAINYARQTFQQEIGGSSQNPNDPDYYQRWLRAQRKCDSLLLAILGSDSFAKFQMQASRQSAVP